MALDSAQYLKDSSLLKTAAYIDGAFVPAADGGVIEVDNPATGEVIGTIPDCTAADTERAIAAAALAWPAWRAKTAGERAKLLRRWFDLIVENADDLATIMTLEQGKPLAEARGEVIYGASFVEWFAEEAKRIYGETIPAPVADRRILVLKQPVGVAAAITPWNFPNAMITRKAAPALAAGCPVVIKPSELTPYSATALAELAERAGIPAGVFSIVTGDARTIGGVMTGSKTVRKLSFTGSTPVGKLLMEQSAATMKRLSLELGGNAPFLVFDDADLDLAIEGVMASKFRNGGQTCVCANRIFVQDGIYDAFVAALTARTEALQVGDGMQAGVEIGPLINDAAVEKVQRHLEDAQNKGATVLTGGAHLGGRLMRPAVLGEATTQMLFGQEETFGPVAPVIRFDTEAAGVALANDTDLGLAGYFYTADLARTFRVAEALETGMVCANVGAFSTEVAPFGGVKESGLGREGAHHGIEEYLEIKALHIGGI